MQEVRVLGAIDLDPIDRRLLDENRRLRLLSGDDVARIPAIDLCQWCNRRGRYNVPTIELVTFLRRLIDGREKETLEICAGSGDLGRFLGVRMTDSYFQVDSPVALELFKRAELSPVPAFADVERLEALEAIKKYNPRVVIGSWVTQSYLPGDENEPKIGSSVYGVDELAIWDQVDVYVHIGNHRVHHDKRILRRPHVTHTKPRLFTRGFYQRDNMIQVWTPGRWVPR